MKSFLLIAAFGFWGLFWIQDYFIQILTGFLMIVYLAFRFYRTRLQTVMILIWIFLSGFSIMSCKSLNAVPDQQDLTGEYIVTEIRSGYAIARKEAGKDRIVVYDSGSLSFQDRIELTVFERVESLNNPGVFSFEKRMEKKGIYYSSSMKSGKLLNSSRSLRAQIWRFFQERYPPESAVRKLVRLYFYSISDDEFSDWIVTMGLPVLGLIFWIRKGLRFFLDSKQTSGLILILILIYGELFFWNTALLRLFVFTFFRIFVKEREFQLPLSMMTFLMLEPAGYSEFSFVLPILLSAGSYFFSERLERVLCSRSILMMLQILYFSKLNLFSLFGYSGLRSLFGFSFLLFIFSLIFQITFLQQVIVQALTSEFSLFSAFSFEGSASQIVVLIFIMAIYYSFRNPRLKSILISYFCIGFYMLSFYIDPFFHVYQLDIGQGDCAVIIEPFRKSVIMIDAAGNTYRDNAGKVIIPFLKSRHISDVDALLISHDDFDHSGSAEALQSSEEIKLKKIIRDLHEVPDVDYPFFSLLENRQDEAGIQASETLDSTEPEDRNDLSMISWFSYDAFSYLWTGDASREVERKLLNSYCLKADVLKAGHHGSKTSSDLEFLQTIQPEIAIISAGINNRYGHPHVQTLKNLKTAGSDVLSTAEYGAVHIMTFHHLMITITSSGLISLNMKSPE